MKKFLSIVFSFCLCLSVAFSVTACKEPLTENQKYMESLNIKKVEDYLYEITYADYDYAVGAQMIDNYVQSFACSSVQLGAMRGRNYDWYYSESADFVIHVPATATRHASIGMASTSSITNALAESGAYHNSYKGLPFFTLDGINDCGLTVNINVMPYGDSQYEFTTMKTPDDPSDDMCGTLIVRYLLDNASNVKEAIDLLNEIDYYALGELEELHFMISGDYSATNKTLQTVVVEFIPNSNGVYEVFVIGDINNDNDYVDASFRQTPFENNSAMIMTNFELASYNGSTDSITPHGMGIERYNILYYAYEFTRTKMEKVNQRPAQTMLELMKQVNYSKAYNLNQEKFWYSEFAGVYDTYGDLNKNNKGDENLHGSTENAGAYKNLLDNYVLPLYEAHNRDNTLWITVHTSIYDVQNKTLSVAVQEGTTLHDYYL